MNAASARIFIVVASLALTGFLLVFLMAAPFLQLPFNENEGENVHLIEIVLPVFFGYLGNASHFLFNANRGRSVPPEQRPLLAILVIGSFGIFTIFIICLFVVFALSNGSPGAMSFDSLSRFFSFGMGLLACTISIIASYLFGTSHERRQSKNARSP